MSESVPARHDPITTAVDGLDALLMEAMVVHKLPGLAAGVVHRDKLVYARCFGSADARATEPITSTTSFRIASVSKTLTAIGVMQLWEQGHFGLDDPVNRYIKGYQVGHPDAAAPPITIRHLLTHTAGIGALRKYSDLLRVNGMLTVKEGAPLPPLPAYYAPVLRAEVYPGTKLAYSNHDFATLGQLIADVTGQDFPTYMRRHVFGALGMQHSDYECSERVRERLAASLKMKRGRWVHAGYPGISPSPAGSVYSTLDDLALYLVALMNGGANEHGRVLWPQTMSLMMTPHVTLDKRLISMGLGFMVEDVGGHHAVGHPGGLPWFASAMLLAPGDRVGVILLTNTYDNVLMAVARKMLRSLLAVPPPAASFPVAHGHATADALRDLTGFYGPQPGLLTNLRFWGAWGGEVQVYVRGDKLYMRSILPVGIARRGLHLHAADSSDPLYFCAFFKDSDVTVVFGHDNTGRITTLCIGPFFALTRRSALQSLHIRTLIALSALLGAAVAMAILRPDANMA